MGKSRTSTTKKKTLAAKRKSSSPSPSPLVSSHLKNAKSSLSPSSKDTPEASLQLLSRGQKKRMAKKVRLAQTREKMVLASLQMKRVQDDIKQHRKRSGVDKRSGIGGGEAMDSIFEALPESGDESIENGSDGEFEVKSRVEHTETTGAHKLSNRSKQELVGKEVTHMGLVLEHPSFRSNPFETIQTHLKNTYAIATEESQSKPKPLPSPKEDSFKKNSSKMEMKLSKNQRRKRRQRR